MTTINCEAGQIKKFIQAVIAGTSESRLHLSKKGVSTISVDTANVCMMKVSLDGSEMKGYSFDGRCPKEVGVEWSKISKFLRAAKANTPLTIKIGKKEISVSYDDIECGVEWLDPNTIRKDPNEPTIELPTTLSVDGSIFNRFSKVISGDKTVILVKDKIAELVSEADVGRSKIFLCRAPDQEDTRAIYSWDYLEEFGKVLDKGYVTLKFKTDHPLRLNSKINGVDIEYLLAPRIEAD